MIFLNLKMFKFVCFYLLSDGAKLPVPSGVVQERPVVKPVVVRAVSLDMYTGSEYSHLVPVDGVAPEKVFHFLCHLQI